MGARTASWSENLALVFLGHLPERLLQEGVQIPPEDYPPAASTTTTTGASSAPAGENTLVVANVNGGSGSGSGSGSGNGKRDSPSLMYNPFLDGMYGANAPAGADGYVEPVDELIEMASQLSERLSARLAEMEMPRQVAALLDSYQGTPERVQAMIAEQSKGGAPTASSSSWFGYGEESEEVMEEEVMMEEEEEEVVEPHAQPVVVTPAAPKPIPITYGRAPGQSYWL